MATASKRERDSESGVIVPFCAFEQKSDFCGLCHTVGLLVTAEGGLRLTKQQRLMSTYSLTAAKR
jgi:hypothetical protein